MEIKSIYKISNYIPGDYVKIMYGEAKGNIGIVSNSYISTDDKRLALMIFIGDDFKNSQREDWITTFSDDVEPIPLTMDILEKNGFYPSYNSWSSSCCSFLHIVINNAYKNEWGIYVRTEKDDIKLLTIKYVHQLQHILYALNIHSHFTL